MVRRMVCGLGVGDGVTGEAVLVALACLLWKGDFYSPDWLIESFYEKVSPALDDDFFFGLKTDFF